MKLSNTDINYDDVVYSPHQLKCFAEVSGLYEQYYYFIYSRQKVLLFRLERVGGFTKAVCEYPNNDTALLQAFLHFCKKKHYIYSIAVDIKLLPLPYFSSSYKIEVDVEEFVLHQKLRYEVNKARKS
ncbi:MAG: hypothetical protein H6767_09795 [Candidatus Peribacteria bacterium]|nr:MAG: hypothetical protein H6767_09795 [Candidatus Peribacteria bacterium]